MNESSLDHDNNEEKKALMIDILDTLREKYSMEDSNIAMAAINLAIGNKSFFINEDNLGFIDKIILNVIDQIEMEIIV